MSNIETLIIAGHVAPSIRRFSKKNKRRRVGILDKDGNTTGYTTLDAVQKQLLLTKKIEISTFDDPEKRPNEVLCKKCELPITVKRTGRIPEYCVICKTVKCSKCGNKFAKSSSSIAKQLKRKTNKINDLICLDCRREDKINLAECASCKCILSRKSTDNFRRRNKIPRCRKCYIKDKNE